MEVLIGPNGKVRYVFADDTHERARQLGPATIRRASHVEPNAEGRWEADLAPVNGPVLGPFDTRQAALDAEREWLNDHGVPVCAPCADR